MKTVAVLVLFFVAASALEKRQFGICVEECSMTVSSSKLLRSISGIGGCPDGHVCASNGCGHTCQPKTSDKSCGDMFCFMYCDEYVKDANGCQTCQCAAKPAPATKCPGVMCAMYCEAGFKTGDDGCPVCHCNPTLG